ncbi:hypothetical protein R1sor_025977 [Riccia sorocarpa]|uniref:Gem-associated protein 2 n=1 Tax=Riccia sorocarpa TaxID=122646 RepID=A0ABD3GE38_9MARC
MTEQNTYELHEEGFEGGDSSPKMEKLESPVVVSGPELVLETSSGELQNENANCEVSDVGHPGFRRYDNDELLGLWDVSVKCEVAWNGVVEALRPAMEEMYQMEAMPETKFLRRRGKNSDRRQRFKARRAAMLSICERREKPKSEESYDPADVVKVRTHKGPLRSRYRAKHYHYDSDEYVESFQPQALAVEGEPDFESGDPQDGWEYLRRVIWETARCPKVVVAQIAPEKLAAEQTPYMPELPAIPQCPPELLPSKDWESSYLADFTQLRKELARLRSPPESCSGRLPSACDKGAWEILCFGSITSVQLEDLEEPVSSTDGATTPATTSPETEEVNDVTENATKELHSSASRGPPDEGTASPVSSELEGHHLTRHDTGNNDWIHVAPEEGTAVEHPHAEEHSETVVITPSAVDEGNYGASGVDLTAALSPLRDSDNAFASGEGEGEGEGEGMNGSTDFSSMEAQSVQDDHPADDEWIHLGTETGAIINGTRPAQTDVVVSASAVPHLSEDNLVSNLAYDGSSRSQVILDPDMDGTVVEKEVTESSEVQEEEYQVESESFYHVNMAPYISIPSADSSEEASAENRTEVPYDAAAAEFGDYPNPWSQGSALGGADIINQYTSVSYDSHYESVDQREVDVSPEYHAEYEEYAAYYQEALEEEDPAEVEVFSGRNLLEDSEEEEWESVAEINGPVQELFTRVFKVEKAWELPLVHTLLRLDAVSRAALFIHHVSWLHSVEGLPQDRALWLLGLAAVVDTPLSGDTTAAFRALLRYCSGVRASEKTTLSDEELHMLNALITIAGLYFGQAETDST